MTMRKRSAKRYLVLTSALLVSTTSWAATKASKGLASNSMVLGMIYMSKASDLTPNKLTIGHSAGKNSEAYEILLKRKDGQQGPHGCCIREKGNNSTFTVVYQDEKANKLVEVDFSGQPKPGAYKPSNGTNQAEAASAEAVLVPIVEALAQPASK